MEKQNKKDGKSGVKYGIVIVCTGFFGVINLCWNTLPLPKANTNDKSRIRRRKESAGMITASVVLYNTPEQFFWKFYQSYEPGSNRKLYIIDNSERETFYCRAIVNENVSYTFNNRNLGYGKAHNIGIRKAIKEHSDYHLVVNSDVWFDSSVLDALQKYADQHRDVVYILPQVRYPNGNIQCLCKLLPTPFDLFLRRFLPDTKLTRRWNDKYTLKCFGYKKIINPPCLSGCFMFLRTAALEENHMEFDERFFLYFEDFDFIRRLHRIGKTIFFPNVEITHRQESGSYKNCKLLLQHIKSAWRYFNKYGWFVDGERSVMNKRILKELEKFNIES